MKKTAVRALCKRLRKARKAFTRMYAGGQDGAQSTAGEQLLAFLPQLCEAAESGLRDLRAAPGLPAGESGLPRAFERLRAFVQEPYAPTLDSLVSSLAGGSFSFTELTLTDGAAFSHGVRALRRRKRGCRTGGACGAGA